MALPERINILLVDDRADGLLTLEAVLQSPEHNLVKASSGREALAHIEKQDFAVILLDVQMPELDGFQTATRIKKIPHAQNIPIVFVTALHKDPFYIYQGYNAGAVDYIFKPFDPGILRSKVAVFVNLYRQQQQIRRQVAEIHRKDEELFQAKKLEAVGRLAGGVAHDFNNLITGILGLTHDVSTSLDARDPRRDDLDEVIKASNRALSLTKQLLAFGRRQIIAPQVLDLNIVIHEMSKMLERLLTEDVEYSTNLGADLCPVKIDQGQVEQIVMNLVLNARDALMKGGKIALATHNVQVSADNAPANVPAGDYAVIQISDNGMGMDRQTLEHIFEPYYTTKEKDKGTGLGLATVYGVVMQCGGRIHVESEPGKGTTFKIYLPKVNAVPETVFHPSTKLQAAGGQETVLVVEDEGIVRQVATRILRKYGYTVFEAKDGKEALNFAESYRAPIHLLITDVVMPRMNGRQLADELTPRRPEMAVLYMSGYSEDVVIHRGVVDPGIAFIEKTFTAPMLLSKAREVIESHSQAVSP